MDLEASLDWRDQSTHYPSSVESADSCSGSACDFDVINSRAAPALGALPPEVIELIGFELACLTPFDAPRDLVSLCLVSKRFQQILSLRSNSRLYARLFKARFDVAALRRRLGLLRGKVLAEEFVGRMVFMSRLKRSVARKRLFEGDEQEGQAQLLGDFWMAFMMMLEHDTKNLDQLCRHAHLRQYLELHYQMHMLQGAIEPGFPPQSADRALSAHLHYFLTSRESMDEESPADAEEKFFVLKPYVFAAHKYSAYFAHWAIKRLPALSSAPTETVPQHFQLQYFGRTLTLRPPVLFHAACLSFSLRADRDPEISGAAALTDVQPGDIILPGFPGAQAASSLHPDPSTDDASPSSTAHLFRAMAARTPSTPLPVLDSKAHDFEYCRLLCCYDPVSSPGFSVQELRGSLKGTWEGRFSFFDFDSYREMLNGRVRSLYEGPFRAQPQVWKIDEVVVKLADERQEGGSGSILNAGFSKTDQPTFAGMHMLHDPLRIRDQLAAHTGPAPLDSVAADEPLDANATYEILLSGSGHSAWGQFVLHGRIRTWDGLFTLAKEYTPEGRGRWLYRGYAVNGGSTLVGRWRDTFTQPEVPGYEGNFVMSKRVAE